MEDRNQRKPNLIVSGLPEKSDGSADDRRRWDMESVEELFHSLCHLNADAISSFHRIGKISSNKPRLLKVVCSDTESKSNLLRKSRDLKNTSKFRNIYLNPDLTPAQMLESKKLRQEWKRRKNCGEDVVIRRGHVVERNSNYFNQNFR